MGELAHVWYPNEGVDRKASPCCGAQIDTAYSSTGTLVGVCAACDTPVVEVRDGRAAMEVWWVPPRPLIGGRASDG